MADLSQAQIDFTYKDIVKWDRDTTRTNFQNPEMRPLIDEVIRRHEASKSVAPPAPAPTPETEYQAAAIKKEAETAQALAAEKERFKNLPWEKQLAELTRLAEEKKAREEGSEKSVIREKIATEKESNYLNAIGETFATPKDRRVEIERRHKERDDKIVAAEAEVEAAAKAAQEAADAKAAADAQALVDAEAAKAVEKATAEKAEADRLAAEAKTKADAEAAARPKQKLVLDFQAEDENGNPIGRRTHLEADTHEELTEKMKTAYINAVRYAERMKKRAAAPAGETPKQEVPPAQVLTAEQRADLEKDLASTDETKKTLAEIKLEKDNLDRAKNADWYVKENKRRDQEAGKFLAIHKDDFLPCEANAKALHDYINSKGLPYNVDSLEEAFDVVRHKLAEAVPAAQPVNDEAQKAAEAAVEAEKQKIEADARATAEAAAKQKFEDEIRAKVLAEIEAKKKLEQEQAGLNTPAVQASVVPAAPAAVPTPVEKTATADNTAATAPKPPAGGIEPGSLHGGRSLPTSGAEKKPVYTRQDIVRMPREEMKKRMRDPKFVRIVNELFGPKQS